MSSYVESVLAEGEQIVYRTQLSHWNFLFHYLVGGLFVVTGLISLLVFIFRPDESWPGLTLVIGIPLILYALIKRLTTELALTNRRVIVKRGLISRETIEMNLNKVESIRVNQGILGRLLKYGDVTLVGTGASPEPLRGIAKPLDLRKQLGEILHK